MEEPTKEGEIHENEQDDDFTSNIERVRKAAKRDFKNIDRQTVILGLMVLGVCIVFFFLGYYFGTHHATIECNKIILENQMMGNVLPPALFG